LVENILSKLSVSPSNIIVQETDDKLKYIQENLIRKESLVNFSGEFMALCNENFEFEFLNQTGCKLLSISREYFSRNFMDFLKEKKSFKEDVIHKLIQKKWLDWRVDDENR
jgi:hypothetical protein